MGLLLLFVFRVFESLKKHIFTVDKANIDGYNLLNY